MSILGSLRLPPHWPLSRLDGLFTRSFEADAQDLEPLSVFTDDGVVPRSSRNHSYKALGADLAKNLRVRPGDLVFNKLRTWQGAIGVSSFDGIVSPAYFVLRGSRQVEPRFFHYMLRSSPWVQELKRVSKYMPPNQNDIAWDDLKAIRVVVPSLHVQRTIADYLDTETARIDTLIEKKQRMRELLDTRFRSLLDSKFSSSERVPLKQLVRFQEGPGIMADDFRDEGVPLIRVSGVGGHEVTLEGCNYLDPTKVHNRWSHFLLDEGDFVISASASMGIASRVGPEAAGAIPYTGLIRFKPLTPAVDMNFIRYFLVGDDFMRQIDQLKTGAAMQHFGPSHLGQVTVPQIGLDGQRRISETISGADSVRLRTSAAIDRQIDRLLERRQALITAAVTGELEVPGVAA